MIAMMVRRTKEAMVALIAMMAKKAKNQNHLCHGYILHRRVGHTACGPEGRKGRCQAGPKGCFVEVGPRRGP